MARSEPLTARADLGSCAGFGVANGRQAVGPEVRLRSSSFRQSDQKTERGLYGLIKALIVLNISYEMAFRLRHDWVFYQSGISLPLLRFFSGFWLICSQK